MVSALVMGYTQAACSVGCPSMSTTHMRHTPATLRSGWLQSVEDGHAERHLGLDAVDGDGDESTDGLGIVGDRHCAADLAGRDARGLLLVSGVVGHAGVLAVSAWAGRLMISSPKCSRMDMKALELVWPRPHLEATCMVPLSSRSSATYSAEQAPPFSCSAEYVAELRELSGTMQVASKCGLGQTSSNAFMSILEHFGDEIMSRPAQAETARTPA